MNKKRDRLGVIFDVLKCVRDNHNSMRPTPLMRSSNLSSAGFAEYLEELTRKDLIKIVSDPKGGQYITLTDKGFQYLEKYRLILGFIDEFEL